MTPPGDDPRDDLVGGPAARRHAPAWFARPAAWVRARVGSGGDPRWRVAGLVVLALVAAAVVVPRLPLSAGEEGRQAQARKGSGPIDEPPGVTAIRWPLRGDLARDKGFVDAAMRRLRADRANVNRALYAGRLPDGSRLLLATSDVAVGVLATTVSALHVPPGRRISGGSVSDVAALTGPDQAVGWATAGSGGQTFAVAIGPPQLLRLEVSGRVDFDPAGTPSRRWRAVSSRTGVVVAALGAGADPSVAVRSLDRTTFATPALVPVAGHPVTAPDQLAVDGVDGPAYAGPELSLLTQALVSQTEGFLDLGGARLRVLWSGVPWRSRHMALVLVTTAEGRRLQVLVGEQDGEWYAAGARMLPAAAPDDLPWLLEPASGADPTQLLCPRGGGSLDYKRVDHPVARVPIRDDGVATLLEPGDSPVRAGGADVVLRDRAGRALLRTRLPTTGFDDPLALDPA